jgi:hypothetical protein
MFLYLFCSAGKLVHQLAARARIRELEHCEAVRDGNLKGAAQS